MEQNRSMLRRVLEGEGYQVVTAPNGLVAQQLMATVTPDVLLSDVQMPEMSGLELCQVLKQSARTACCRWYLINTATRIGRTASWRFEAGADELHR
jgi:CheY-like chemotaxis protein